MNSAEKNLYNVVVQIPTITYDQGSGYSDRKLVAYSLSVDEAENLLALLPKVIVEAKQKAEEARQIEIKSLESRLKELESA